MMLNKRLRSHYISFSHLFLYITQNCQLRCHHCYMGNRLNFPIEMDYDMIEKTLIKSKNLGATIVTLIGGEPTIHSDFERIITCVNKIGFERIIVDTNAIDIKALLNLDVSSITDVHVSLDGATANTHEMIRGHGTFKRTIDNITLLIKKGYSISLTFTANNENIHEIFSIIDLAESLCVSKVNIHTISEEGKAKQSLNLSIKPLDWIAIYNKLNDLQTSVDIWYPPTWAYKKDIDYFINRGYIGCLGISTDRLSIFPDRKAYVCSLLFDYPLNFLFFSQDGVYLNTGKNEYELFINAKANSNNIEEIGCPAESIILGNSTLKSDLISICRCWKTQVSGCKKTV